MPPVTGLAVGIHHHNRLADRNLHRSHLAVGTRRPALAVPLWPKRTTTTSVRRGVNVCESFGSPGALLRRTVHLGNVGDAVHLMRYRLHSTRRMFSRRGDDAAFLTFAGTLSM